MLKERGYFVNKRNGAVLLKGKIGEVEYYFHLRKDKNFEFDGSVSSLNLFDPDLC